jgi:hypothetical protein
MLPFQNLKEIKLFSILLYRVVQKQFLSGKNYANVTNQGIVKTIL